MSVIQDCETVNEQDTIMDENIGSDDDQNAHQRYQDENVLESNDRPDYNLGQSILSNEEQS